MSLQKEVSPAKNSGIIIAWKLGIVANDDRVNQLGLLINVKPSTWNIENEEKHLQFLLQFQSMPL